MMELSEKLQEALVAQVQKEYEAGQLYNGMRIYFDDANLHGAKHWMTLQWQEELTHAQDFIDFILEADGEIKSVGAIPEVSTDYEGLKDVFATGLDHEKEISQSIREALEIAIEDGHYAAENFLRTYIDEQVEEEDNFRGVLELVEFAGDDKAALLKVDGILGKRED